MEILKKISGLNIAGFYLFGSLYTISLATIIAFGIMVIFGLIDFDIVEALTPTVTPAP